MKISVVIPTFNRAHLLPHAIQSALQQTHAPYEILLIDDGSTDNTAEVAAQFAAKVHYLRQPNAGKASALNAGFALATGDAIIVLDDDDLLPSTAVQGHVSALTANSAADFSYGRFVRFFGTAPVAHPSAEAYESVPVGDSRRLVVKLMECSFLPNPTWAVRRSAADSVGPYRSSMRYSEDYDMILRLSRRNEGVFVDAPVLYQRKHEGFRGPNIERVYTLDAVSKWITYDRELFERLDDEWELADFRPYLSDLHEQGEAVAWLQRGVVLFMRKAYERAFRSLDQYRALLGRRFPSAHELMIASSLLGCRYGIDDVVTSGETARRLSEYCWPLTLRRAFSRHLRWRLRDAFVEGNWREVSDISAFGVRAFGSVALAQSMMNARGGARQMAGSSNVRY